MNKNYRMDSFVKGEAAFRVEREDIVTFLKECDGYNLRWRSGQKASEYNPFYDGTVYYIELTDEDLVYSKDQSDVALPIIYDYKAHLKEINDKAHLKEINDKAHLKEINDKTYNFTKLLNEVRVITTRLQRAERAFYYIDDLNNAKNFDVVIHRNDSRDVNVDLNSKEDSGYIKDTLKDIKRRELTCEGMEAIELICKLAQELDRVTGIDISSEEVDD